MQSFILKRLKAIIILCACASMLFTTAYTPKLQTSVVALYPNLKTLPPRDLRFDRTDVSVEGIGTMHNVLRFSNTVYNVGEGKMEMRATINPATQDGVAYQRVYNTDGTFSDYQVGTLYYHPQHQHYHFEDWGQYQLWTKAEYDKYVNSGKTQGQFKKAGVKTTSCVMDEEFIMTIAGTPYPGQYPSSGCSPNAQNFLLEGLSVGWGDTYDYYRFEQWIDLDQETLADGVYVLRSVTDPLNKMVESAGKADTSRESISDNEAIIMFTVSGGQILDGAVPSGTVFINNVDTTTAAATVNVNVIGRDDVSGVGSVSLSNDGVTWASYTYTGVQSVAQTISWDLTNPQYGGNSQGGVKTVYARFQDKSGKVSEIQSDTIYFDAPTSDYSLAALADSPVSYWRLSEGNGTTAADTKVTNNGVYTNNPTLGASGLIASDPASKAVRFDGVNDYVAINNSASLSIPTAVTLEAWINPESIPAAGSFASVITKPESYSIQFNGPRLEFTIIQNGTRQRLQAPVGAIVVGQTYHVVGTYDGTTQRLFINGVEAVSRAQTGNITTNTNKLYIGSWNGNIEYFKGTLDDVAVYNFALSAARAKAHYDIGTGGYTISGNAGVAGATLSYTDGTAKTATADAAGLYSFQVARNWSGTVTPSKAGYTFQPASRTYTAITSNQTAQDYTATSNVITYTITGNAGVAGATLSYTDGTAKTVTADGTGSYTFQVSNGWSGTVTPTKTGYTFLPVNRVYTNVVTNQIAQNYTATLLTYMLTTGKTGNGTGVINSSPAGVTCGTTCAAAFPYNTIVTLTATADSGFIFTGWNGAGCTGSGTCQVTMDAAKTVNANFAVPTYTQRVLADNPVSYWRLGETSGTTAADSLNKNPGTYVNGPVLGTSSLLTNDANSAVTFDGVNDQVRVANSTSMNITGSLSLEAWINPSSLPAAGSFASIITKNNSYSLQFNGPRLEFTIMQSTVRKRCQAPVGAIVTGQKYHIVGTYDGANQNLYINGALAVTCPLTGAISSTTNTVYIASWNGSVEFFKGAIDEVAVYNTALTPAKVKEHYDAR